MSKPKEVEVKILSKAELKEYEKWYSDMIELSDIFNHDIAMVGETIRWKPNSVSNYIVDGKCPFYRGDSHIGQTIIRGSMSINDFWTDIYNGVKPERNGCGKLDILDVMKFYMEIGYSLSGYGEVFGQRSAEDFFKDAAPAKLIPEFDDGHLYPENILEYVCRVYKGKVLRV